MTAGTIFQDSKLPLTTWFRAIWRVTSQKSGASAMGLQRVLGLGSYKTAWAIGRIRPRCIPDLTRSSLHGCIAQAIEPGSTVVTDGLNAYGAMKDHTHRLIVVRKQTEDASTPLPRVHRAARLLKRWLLGTHQGAVGHEHLEYHLDEFTFRFNRRTSASRGRLFHRLARQTVQIRPAPFDTLIRLQSLAARGRSSVRAISTPLAG